MFTIVVFQLSMLNLCCFIIKKKRNECAKYQPPWTPFQKSYSTHAVSLGSNFHSSEMDELPKTLRKKILIPCRYWYQISAFLVPLELIFQLTWWVFIWLKKNRRMDICFCQLRNSSKLYYFTLLAIFNILQVFFSLPYSWAWEKHNLPISAFCVVSMKYLQMSFLHLEVSIFL